MRSLPPSNICKCKCARHTYSLTPHEPQYATASLLTRGGPRLSERPRLGHGASLRVRIGESASAMMSVPPDSPDRSRKLLKRASSLIHTTIKFMTTAKHKYTNRARPTHPTFTADLSFPTGGHTRIGPVSTAKSPASQLRGRSGQVSPCPSDTQGLLSAERSAPSPRAPPEIAGRTPRRSSSHLRGTPTHRTFRQPPSRVFSYAV